MKPKHNYTPSCSDEEKHRIHAKMLKKQEETATTLCRIAQKIVFGIKSKYSYSDSEVKIYLQGYIDCAEDNQKALEKRDKMLRDTVEELCEAKRLLKAAVEDMTKEADCGICLHDNDNECPIKVTACKFKWRHADEALALIGEDTNVPASADDTNVGDKGGADDE